MRIPMVILGLAVCLPSPTHAILIETVAGGRVAGYFIREDAKKLYFSVRTPEGDDRFEDIEKAKIKRILSQVDRSRLVKLSRDDPQGYRDYAETLAKEPADPEARDVAMRLFLISAHLDPKKFGSSSLMRMSAIASTPEEARRCRVMAFLLDPDADASFLKAGGANPEPAEKLDPDALHDFQKTLQHYRSGKVLSSLELLKKESVEKVFSLAPGMRDSRSFRQSCADALCFTCGKNEAKGKLRCTTCNGSKLRPGGFGGFCTVCNGKGLVNCGTCQGLGVQQNFTIPDEVMRTLVKAELWSLEQINGGGAKNAVDDASWSYLLQTRQVKRVPTLTLETITEFDPRKSTYRNGAWVETP